MAPSDVAVKETTAPENCCESERTECSHYIESLFILIAAQIERKLRVDYAPSIQEGQ